jgi:hypothetical protein
VADKPGPFSVRPLRDFLGGADPSLLTIKLMNAGYRGFYVRIPSAYQLRGTASSAWALAAMPDLTRASMVELTKDQLIGLIERERVELTHFSGAALCPEQDAVGVPTRRFIRQTHYAAVLVPIEGGRTDIGLDGYVRSQPIPGSSEYRYTLRVTYADLYVEECDLVASSSRELISHQAADPPQTDEVPDPYGLKTTSPVVHEIMKIAYSLREGQGKVFDATKVLSILKEKDLGFKKNPNPFKNDQGKFAAQLADRSYEMKQARPGMGADHLEFLKTAPELDQDYYNPGMKKLLYAACCWSGQIDAGCKGNVEGLAKLLTQLGFRDEHGMTEVRYMLFFITGKKQPHPDEVKSKAARRRATPSRRNRS